MDSIVAIHDFAYDDYFLFYQLRWSKDLIKRALTNYAHSTVKLLCIFWVMLSACNCPATEKEQWKTLNKTQKKILHYIRKLIFPKNTD